MTEFKTYTFEIKQRDCDGKEYCSVWNIAAHGLKEAYKIVLNNVFNDHDLLALEIKLSATSETLTSYWED